MGFDFCVVVNFTNNNNSNSERAKGSLLGLQLLTICRDLDFRFPWRRVTAQWIFFVGLNWMNVPKISDPKPICAHWCRFFFFGGTFFFPIHSYAFQFFFFQSNKYSICIDNPLKFDRSLILVHAYGWYFVLSFTPGIPPKVTSISHRFNSLRLFFFIPVPSKDSQFGSYFIFYKKQNVSMCVFVFFSFIHQQNTMKMHIIRSTNAIYRY